MIFDDTYVHVYRRTRTHNPPAYCARVIILLHQSRLSVLNDFAPCIKVSGPMQNICEYVLIYLISVNSYTCTDLPYICENMY